MDALPGSLQDGTLGMLLEFWFSFLLILLHKKKTKTCIYLNICEYPEVFVLVL